MAKAQIILGELGGGGGTCALIHVALPTTSQKNVSIVTQNNATHYYYGASDSGNKDLSDTDIGTITFNATVTSYACSLTIVPNKTFNYRLVSYTQASGNENNTDSGIINAGSSKAIDVYYYGTSTTKPQQVDLLLWE